MIELITFLGNYGKKYENTRHNAAWIFSDLADISAGAVWQSKFKGRYAKIITGDFGGKPVHLLKPETFVNLSGESVGAAVSFFRLKPENILIAIGPHIRECCYIVDEERALYFANNFSEGCISEYAAHDKDSSRLKWKNNGTKQFHLSLEKANLSIIGKLNIPEGNITLLQDCTCCNEIYGSNRRQTSKGEVFTVQAAFVKSGTAEKNVSF